MSKVAKTTYRVTNSAGGTELRTPNKDRALARLNKLQFPGDVLRLQGDSEQVVPTELDDAGQWVEVAS